jgi:quercetin dioxygenase-like cupin family protein
MEVQSWDGIEKEQLNPLSRRQVIHCETMTVARMHLKKGCVVPVHSHPNEQISMIEQGSLHFKIGGAERILSAGELVRIPPDVPHSVTALEDSVAVDLFSPPRQDWIRGDDAYLRQ